MVTLAPYRASHFKLVDPGLYIRRQRARLAGLFIFYGRFVLVGIILDSGYASFGSAIDWKFDE